MGCFEDPVKVLNGLSVQALYPLILWLVLNEHNHEPFSFMVYSNTDQLDSLTFNL
ncbi:hypothetical protein WICANDRAFT_91324 [Wickerhamomyces anomalus NRRL Y-366-8]|uniref:Uncharacterized protein n=1 Tax=Wickerhamomyces anomalus (strain ATCC 58044 / CBS 1984 / NCYC 433 / NRRL Y-366-8) TaxID=683960 RepID=A0A1E3P2W9_WICAA|nr:uncharacterized protein WICANDRAFT_91324 [Wickerhamomyces anomalus NRRL Y-366-8]ODQ59600.1 hypothetical protein WICANDRAFT_91324 [Wickerhamomyces anomalus NRRL Y-366-8]